MTADDTATRQTGHSDECPYHRPFPANFDECPAYLQTEYVGLDLQHRPLPPAWTCQNLEAAQRGNRPGAHYGRCRLGAEADRLEWLRRVEQSRLTSVLETRREFNTELHDLTLRLWAAKGRVLQAPADEAARRELVAVADEYKTACDEFFERRSDMLREAGVPLEPTQKLVRGMVDRIVASRSTTTSPGIPAEELAEFPPALRFFLEPGAGAGQSDLQNELRTEL